MKVLIVDDSLIMRIFLKKVFLSDPAFTVIETAFDGVSALKVIPQLKPDVITLDIEMPRMNGLETLKEIRKTWDMPVIMVSSLTARGADFTIRSLELGASDWIQKPDQTLDKCLMEEMTKSLLNKVKSIVKKTDVSGRDSIIVSASIPSVKEGNINFFEFLNKAKVSSWVPKGKIKLDFKIVAIGVSTGGPSALNKVIPELPEDLNAAVIIVQHMPETFTRVLAERLDGISKMKVKLVEQGENVQKGYVYVVPGGSQIRLKEEGTKVCLLLDKYEKIDGFQPSAEVLFYFVGEVARKNSIGVVMTGMGSDGSYALGVIKKYSENTIAQDKDTCVVFGMPKIAIEKRNVKYILPLSDIADKIIYMVDF